MGNSLNFHKIDNRSGYIDDNKKYPLLCKLKVHFIDNAIVEQINGFGDVSDNYHPSHTQNMKNFFQQALEDDSPLISSIHIWNNHPKTWNTHISIKIRKNEDNTNIKEITLKCVQSRYDPVVFESGRWLGRYYENGKLC